MVYLCVRACVRAWVCVCVHADVREESERVRERQNGESERLSERQRRERVRARECEREETEREETERARERASERTETRDVEEKRDAREKRENAHVRNFECDPSLPSFLPPFLPPSLQFKRYSVVQVVVCILCLRSQNAALIFTAWANLSQCAASCAV